MIVLICCQKLVLVEFVVATLNSIRNCVFEFVLELSFQINAQYRVMRFFLNIKASLDKPKRREPSLEIDPAKMRDLSSSLSGHPCLPWAERRSRSIENL